MSWDNLQLYISKLSDSEIQEQLCDLSEFTRAYREYLLQEVELRKTQPHTAGRNTQREQSIRPNVTIKENGEIKRADEQRDNCSDNGTDSSSLHYSTIMARRLALVNALQQSKPDADVLDIEAINNQICAISKTEKDERNSQKRRMIAEMLRRGESIEADCDRSGDAIEIRTTSQASEAAADAASTEAIQVPLGFID